MSEIGTPETVAFIVTPFPTYVPGAPSGAGRRTIVPLLVTVKFAAADGVLFGAAKLRNWSNLAFGFKAVAVEPVYERVVVPLSVAKLTTVPLEVGENSTSP